MEKFHKIVATAKLLANKQRLQGDSRVLAMQNYVLEELNRALEI